MNYRIVKLYVDTSDTADELNWEIVRQENVGTLHVDSSAPKAAVSALYKSGHSPQKIPARLDDYPGMDLRPGVSKYWNRLHVVDITSGRPLFDLYPVGSGMSTSDIALIAGGVTVAGLIGYLVLTASQNKAQTATAQALPSQGGQT